MSKISFLRRILLARLRFQPRICPYCGSPHLKLLGRKKLVLDVLQCKDCSLIFRYPMDTIKDNVKYYQKEYKSRIVANLPDVSLLRVWVSQNFSQTPLDMSAKIKALKKLRRTGYVLDYGCSWGYGVFQLNRAGFEAVGFEISKPRAQFGRENLSVHIIDASSELLNLSKNRKFDIIFTNHVLEHLPNPRQIFDLFSCLLADGGILFNVLPNFTGRKAREGMFWNWIGEAHPIAPTVDFFERNLPKHGFSVVCGSSPFDEDLFNVLVRKEWKELQTDGDELLVIGFKNSFMKEGL